MGSERETRASRKAPRVYRLPTVDERTLDLLFDRGKELFTTAIEGQQPGRSWEECDPRIRQMWACAAAEEMGYQVDEVPA